MKTLNNWNDFVNESNVSDLRKKLSVDYEKIAKTIKSIDKLSQVETTENMIDNFDKKYINDIGELYTKKGTRVFVAEHDDFKERVKELKSVLKLKEKELKKENK